MRPRIYFGSAGVFLAVLLASFPYDGVLRAWIGRRWPNVMVAHLSASPWSGLHMTDVRLLVSPGLTVSADGVDIHLIGLFPPQALLEIRRDDAWVRLKARPLSQLIPFELTAEGAQAWMPASIAAGAPQQIQSMVSASGRWDRQSGRFSDGTKVSIQMAGDLTQMSDWSLILGKHLTEGVVSGETRDGALIFSEIRLRTESGGFAGLGEIRPLFPLSAASLILKGTATIGRQTLTVDKTLPLGGWLNDS